MINLFQVFQFKKIIFKAIKAARNIKAKIKKTIGPFDKSKQKRMIIRNNIEKIGNVI